MLHTFLLKRQSKRYTIIKFCHSNNSNGKDLTVLFKMGLSWDISRLSLISKLILLESLDKMVKSSKVYVAVTSQQVIWNSWLLNIFKTFVCQMWNSHMFSCFDVKMAFCFAIINSVAAITLKNKNDVRAEFFGKHIFKMKMVDNFRRWSENDF